MPSDLSKKIDGLTQKLAQLKAQKQQSEALQNARFSAAKRKDDARRKILLGSFVLNKLNLSGASSLVVKGQLFDEWLTRPNDRNLFGLPVANPKNNELQNQGAEG